MGAIGPAVFSDDVACDVRDAYKRLIDEGRTGIEATDYLLAEWLKDLPPQDDDAMVFWLALAATQTRLGRLEDRVRDRALAIIAGGEDLARWREVGLEGKRQAALLKLKDQLLEPQPQPKKVRVQKLYNPEWTPGQYVTVRLLSGRKVIWQVHSVDDVSGVACSALEWQGEMLPDMASVPTLPVKSFLDGRGNLFVLATFKKRGIPHGRLEVLPVSNPRPRGYRGGAVMWFWENLDYHLRDQFGWE